MPVTQARQLCPISARTATWPRCQPYRIMAKRLSRSTQFCRASNGFTLRTVGGHPSKFTNCPVDQLIFRRNAEKMSRKRTIAVATVAFLANLQPAFAQDDVAYTFAECAGRFSAEMEHAWLMNDPRADAFQEDRASFVVLTTASMAPDQGRSVLGHRIEVKLAHAALLQQATFATSDAHANAARATAQRHLASCRSLLLGS